MLRSIALEQTLPMVYYTCISDLHNMCFKHLKLMLTDRQTDRQTDRLTDRQTLTTLALHIHRQTHHECVQHSQQMDV